MKVLFIGGTGIISSACTALAVRQGIELYLLNRGKTTFRNIPEGARLLNSDINNLAAVTKLIDTMHFDAVVDWIVFTPEQLERDINLFRGRTDQYIFISSASVYQKPISHLPITESTPIDNPFWSYSQNKIICEERLVQAYHLEKFPAVIVRPSHTYDCTLLPFDGGWTVVDRMLRGKPVVVHGDGTTLWTMTHHRDFAVGFNGLLGNPHALGNAFHITSDESLTWNQIYAMFARAVGVEPKLVHVPSEIIASYDSDWGAGLLGDKANSVFFDNSKIKRLVPEFNCTIPYFKGVDEVVTWYEAHPEFKKISAEINRLQDEIIQAITNIRRV